MADSVYHTTMTEGTCRWVFMFSSSTASSCNTWLHVVSSHSQLFISWGKLFSDFRDTGLTSFFSALPEVKKLKWYNRLVGIACLDVFGHLALVLNTGSSLLDDFIVASFFVTSPLSGSGGKDKVYSFGRVLSRQPGVGRMRISKSILGDCNQD